MPLTNFEAFFCITSLTTGFPLYLNGLMSLVDNLNWSHGLQMVFASQFFFITDLQDWNTSGTSIILICSCGTSASVFQGKREKGWLVKSGWSVPGEIYAQGIMASSRCHQDSTTITSKIILGNHATAYPSLTNHAPFTLLLRFHILLNPYLCLSPALQNALTWRTFSQGTRNTCFQSSPSTGILVMEWILKSLKTHRFTKHLNPGLFVFLIVLSLFLQGFSLIGFLDFESIS